MLLYPWHRVSHLPLPLHPECARRACIEGRTRPPASRYGPLGLLNVKGERVSYNGRWYQFNIQELGGNGQWMSGGMTMVGDMFNYGLQGTVSNLCGELSNAMANGSFFKRQQTIAGSAWWPEEFAVRLRSCLGSRMMRSS